MLSAQTFFLIPQFYDRYAFAFPANCVAWSLFAEVVANICFVLGIFRWRTPVIALAVAAGAVFVACLPILGSNMLDRTIDLLRIACLKSVAEFCLGILLFRIRNRLEELPVVCPEVLFCLYLVVAVLPISGPRQLIDVLFIFGLFPVLIALLIRSEGRAPRWSGIAGQLSYPLYACHIGVVFSSYVWANHLSDWYRVPLVIFVTLWFSWLISWMNAGIQTRLHPCPVTAGAG